MLLSLAYRPQRPIPLSGTEPPIRLPQDQASTLLRCTGRQAYRADGCYRFFASARASTSPFPLAPVVAIPFSKPANYAFDKIASPRANKPTSPIKRPSNLEVLKECGSKCQRRDHQAVGSIRHGQVSNNALLTKGDEAGRGFRPLQQAQYVLEQTAAVPWLAIETGRNAIRSIADLD